MLYLAEVIQKRGGIMGGGKAELRLLACQRAEQNWSAVTNDEIVSADEASKYSPGTLLLVDLTASKQVQRVQEAGRPLVSILQNFSRLQEKFKTQEEEIEQWKQSLTYQSQELNRREMEMEARREQLEQLEDDFEQLEQQRQQMELSRGELDRKQEDTERQKQELEGAWAHLRGEMQRLEEHQAVLQQSPVLDAQKSQQIAELLQQMERCIGSAEGFQENTQQATELLAQHQAILSGHWQNLEQQRSQVDHLRGDVDRHSQDLTRQWQEWREQQRVLEQAKSELKLQQATLQMKEEYARLLGLQIQRYTEVHQQLYGMAEGLDSVNVASQIDLEALEKMPIDALQSLTHSLQGDLEKSSQFVRGQEEELDLKQQELEGLEAKLAQVNEFDRMTLEAELADERDAYQFLEDTLVGQRRNLKEKEGLLKQHCVILAKRQGKPDPYAHEGGMNLGPVFSQLDGFRQQQSEELQQVESQIAQTRNAIDQTKGMVDQQTQDLDNRRKDLETKEQNLQTQRLALGELTGKVALYQEMLQPLQDTVSGLQQRLEGMAGTVSQLQQSGNEQRQALAQVQEVLAGLAQQPQLAAS